MLKMSACQKQAPKSNRGCTGYATDNSQLLFSILSSQKWTQLYSNLVNLSTQDTHQSIGWKWHFTVDKYSLPYFTGKIQFSGSPRSSNVKKCLSLCRYIYISGRSIRWTLCWFWSRDRPSCDRYSLHTKEKSRSRERSCEVLTNRMRATFLSSILDGTRETVIKSTSRQSIRKTNCPLRF